MYSYDPDVIKTFVYLEMHYPPCLKESKDAHLFLSPIDNPLTPVWFKLKEVPRSSGVFQGVNLGINQIRKFLKYMAQETQVTGNITNKSGRKTAVNRMALAGVPRHVMASITGHRNLSSLDRYDDTADLDRMAAQLATRMPYGSDPQNPQHRDFQYFKDIVTDQYHKQQIGDVDKSSGLSIDVLDTVVNLDPSACGISVANTNAVISTTAAVPTNGRISDRGGTTIESSNGTILEFSAALESTTTDNTLSESLKSSSDHDANVRATAPISQRVAPVVSLNLVLINYFMVYYSFKNVV